MLRTSRLSVAAAIHSSALVMVLVVAAFAIGLHEFHRRRDANHVRNQSAVVMADAICVQLRGQASGAPDGLRKACDRIVEQQEVFAACVWNEAGEPLAGTAVSQELLQWLFDHPPIGSAFPAVGLAQIPENLRPQPDTVRRVDADFGVPRTAGQPARLTLLLRGDVPSVSQSNHLAAFHLPMMLAGFACALLGTWRIRRELVRPLLSLLSAAARYRCEGPDADLTERLDELGVIARSLAALREDVGAWKDRAELIERRMDSQIAAETQDILRDFKRLQREVWMDPLTRVNNRRMFDEQFPAVFAAQRQARHDLSVVMFDMDHFKLVNDALGHVVGDAVLSFLGDLLRQCLRGSDVAVRYGGDEFLLILPGHSAQNAAALSDRLIALFNQRAKMIAEISPAPSMTAGIASLQRDKPSSPRQMIAIADRALYEAKRAKQRGAAGPLAR